MLALSMSVVMTKFRLTQHWTPRQRSSTEHWMVFARLGREIIGQSEVVEVEQTRKIDYYYCGTKCFRGNVQKRTYFSDYRYLFLFYKTEPR